VLRGIVEYGGFTQLHQRGGGATAVIVRQAESLVAHDAQRSVLVLLGERQALLAVGDRALEVGARRAERGEPVEDSELRGDIQGLGTQIARATIHLGDMGIAVAVECDQRNRERDLQLELTAVPLRSLGLIPEHLDRPAQVPDRFGISRLLDRPLAGPLVVIDRALGQARFFTVERNHLRLSADQLGEALLERSCDVGMHRTSHAQQQRLIGRVSHECMLEGIAPLSGGRGSVHQPGLHEIHLGALHRVGRQR